MARHAALTSFLKQGDEIHQVWGDLRSEYFQNAFFAGTRSIDVSNDTVVPTKPAVEILPLAAANLRPIEEFVHFGCIDHRYWQAQLHPNHLLPALSCDNHRMPTFLVILVLLLNLPAQAEQASTGNHIISQEVFHDPSGKLSLNEVLDGQALRQLIERGYAEKYRARGERIHLNLIGVEFSRERRSVVGFEVEQDNAAQH